MVDLKEFQRKYGELAVRGARALNEEDIAMLAKFVRENFTTGKAWAIMGAVDSAIAMAQTQPG
jgi:hypothetical protein